MRCFECTHVLRPDGSRTSWENRGLKTSGGGTQKCRAPWIGGSTAAAWSCSKSVRKGLCTLMLLLLSTVFEPRAA
jgi:hypothetical protein